MKMKNKQTKEVLDLTRSDFEKKFSNEINTALESYTKTELSKPYFKINKNIESDFYFNLQWNFNNFSNSNWFIEKM